MLPASEHEEGSSITALKPPDWLTLKHRHVFPNAQRVSKLSGRAGNCEHRIEVVKGQREEKAEQLST
jgi:hypothetical protein